MHHVYLKREIRMRWLTSHQNVSLFVGTLMAIAVATVLVWLTKDGSILSHWIEIVGAGVGVFVALLVAQRLGAPKADD